MKLLGKAAGGEPLLLYRNGAYELHPEVSVDWIRFQRLVARAIAAGNRGASDLHDALSLIRGEPLEGCDYWWIDPVLIEHMRASIVEAAALLGHLQASDPCAAAWAACRGLLADPYAEQLYRTLMRASAVLGHVRGVHVAYGLCVQALGLLDLAPHESTIALHDELTRTRTQPPPRTPPPPETR